jgi:hypothetical protein
MTNINPQGDQRTPNLASVIRRAIESALRSTYTMMPGRVESFDPDTQTANVQPLIRYAFPGQTVNETTTEEDLLTDLPVLPDVPILFPRSKSSTIYWRIDPGSLVMLVFGTFSLEKFLVSNAETIASGTIDPQDPRHHDLSDAVAIPGLYPEADPIANFDPADIRLINEPEGGPRTEVKLGGDTGDVALIVDRYAQLGDEDADEFTLLGETAIADLQTLAQSFITNAATFVQVASTPGPGILNPTVVTDLGTFISSLAAWLTAKAKVS